MKYTFVFLYHIAYVFIILAALNSSINRIFHKNFINKIDNECLKTTFYTFVLLSCLFFIIYRNVKLPFLGETVLPPKVLKEQSINNPNNLPTLEFTINGDGAQKVIYWASNYSLENKESPWSAYEGFDNSGVVDIKNDKAVLKIITPSRYKVGIFNKLLPKHIHYRLVYKNGWVSDIKTIYF